MKKIAIIGSREPTKIQELFASATTGISLKLGYNIATGMSPKGIDYIAVLTCVKNKKTDRLYLYLPWSNFSRNLIPEGAHIIVYNRQKDWTESVYKYHPNIPSLSEGAFKLHARNYGIVEGCTAIVACPSYKPGYGGTGQGMRIAGGLGIPLFICWPKETRENALKLAKCFKSFLEEN